MSPKTQAIWSGIAAGVTGYVAYFIALPPSLQTGIMGEIIALLPAQYQTFAAGVAKTASTFLGFYATYKAAHSGPQTPPQTVEDKVAPTIDHKTIGTILLILGCAFSFSGCAADLAAYNKTVTAREDSFSGYTKDGGGGARWTHRVEY